MSNMSYCMFENTVGDMRDCIAKLDELGIKDCIEGASSEHEASMLQHVVKPACVEAGMWNQVVTAQRWISHKIYNCGIK